MHTRAPGTFIGIGFIGGGGADGKSDGEAGLYAESFKALGTLTVTNCSFDGNENGIFVPNYSGALDGSGGENIDVVIQNSVFSYKSGNGNHRGSLRGGLKCGGILCLILLATNSIRRYCF